MAGDLAAIPPLLYGTAWKEDRTEALVGAALAAGFRGIDTANQRKHYHEAAVGAALARAFASGLVTRDELFLQTKFTYMRGQDHRLPYDRDAPLAAQVAQSFASSCEHLGVDRLDALVLHGPASYPLLADADREVWRAMEALHADGRVASLGISNVLVGQLEELCATATVKPVIVQNRAFAMPDADRDVRAFARANGLAYEGFSLLTAIPRVVAHPIVRAIAAREGATEAMVVLRYCADRGMVVLTGTTSETHMRDDLALERVALSESERRAIDALVA
ncbi:MAG: aldo/keto reductase family protein [Thermoplasmatota archaeon]